MPGNSSQGKLFIVSFVAFTIGGFGYSSIYLPYFSKEGKERQKQVIEKIKNKNKIKSQNQSKNDRDMDRERLKDNDKDGKTFEKVGMEEENIEANQVKEMWKSNNMWKNITRMKQQQERNQK